MAQKYLKVWHIEMTFIDKMHQLKFWNACTLWVLKENLWKLVIGVYPLYTILFIIWWDNIKIHSYNWKVHCQNMSCFFVIVCLYVCKWWMQIQIYMQLYKALCRLAHVQWKYWGQLELRGGDSLYTYVYFLWENTLMS